MIELHTLGDALIKVGDKEIRPTSPLVFAALLYLCVERGRRVSRAALQELLFPDRDERSGAHSMRQLLYKLRQLGVELNTAGDLVVLTTAVCRDDTLAATIASFVRTCESEPRFLFSYEPNISAQFEAWLEQKRASINFAVTRVLQVELAEAREARNHDRVESVALSVLALDPYNEEATLCLAEVRALEGSKAKAVDILTQYEAQTARAGVHLNASVLRKRISERLPDRSPLSADLPFVGRERELALLSAVVEGRETDVPTLVLVWGEAGIGKTRLLEEISRRAIISGTHMIHVRCRAHYAQRTMAVFIELAPLLLGCRGSLGASPESLATLRLLSHKDETERRHVDSSDDVTRAAELGHALNDVLGAVTSEGRLVLVVEDAHWADADSLLELGRIARDALPGQLTVLCTSRTVPSPERLPLPKDSSLTIRLRPLPPAAMESLARQLINRSTPTCPIDDVRSWCVRVAAGNPFFLQTLGAHYESSGAPFSVPSRLAEATSRRLDILSRGARAVLELTALLGRHATLETVKGFFDGDDHDFLGAVRSLEEDGLLRLQDDVVRVIHDLVTDSVVESIPPISKQFLHARIAKSLEARAESVSDAGLLWDTADHWLGAGNQAKAIEFLISCARHSAAIGRASQALSLLGRAQELARRDAERRVILGEMMLSAKAAGKWAQVFDLSLQLKLLLDPGEHQHTEQEIVAIEASWNMKSPSPDDVTTLLRCISAPDANPSHRLNAALLTIRLAHEQANDQAAGIAYTAVRDLCSQCAQTEAYLVGMIEMIYHVTFGDLRLGHRAARQTVERIRYLPTTSQQLRAAHNAALAFCYCDAATESVQVLRTYYDLAVRLELKNVQFDYAANICWVYLENEDFLNAQVWHQIAESCLQEAQEVGAWSTTRHRASALEIAVHLRDFAAARKHLESLDDSTGGSVRAGYFKKYMGVLIEQASDGNYQVPEEKLSELLQAHAINANLLGADGLTMVIAEALWRRSDFTGAARLLERYVNHQRRELFPMSAQLDALWRTARATISDERDRADKPLNRSYATLA